MRRKTHLVAEAQELGASILIRINSLRNTGNVVTEVVVITIRLTIVIVINFGRETIDVVYEPIGCDEVIATASDSVQGGKEKLYIGRI